MDLYGCGCDWKELPNNVVGSTVKGHTLVKECKACKAKREANAKLAAQQKIEQDKELKIKQEQDAITRKQAIDSLKAKGELK